VWRRHRHGLKNRKNPRLNDVTVHEEEDGDEATAAEGIHGELRAVRNDLRKVHDEISRVHASIMDVEEKLKVLFGIKFENMCDPFLQKDLNDRDREHWWKMEEQLGDEKCQLLKGRSGCSTGCSNRRSCLRREVQVVQFYISETCSPILSFSQVASRPISHRMQGVTAVWHCVHKQVIILLRRHRLVFRCRAVVPCFVRCRVCENRRRRPNRRLSRIQWYGPCVCG
jgi:hypothetical protein